MDQQKTDARIQADEGTGPMRGGRCLVYDDATGKAIVPGSHVIGHPTVGIGRALDVNGISMAEALYLEHNDETDGMQQLDRVFPWWRNLDDVRQAVMISLEFNMGVGSALLGTGMQGFKNTMASFAAGDYAAAANGLRNSKWYTQVGDRGPRLAKMLETGAWA